MKQNLPRHIALIPDGNRRWAKKKGKVPWEGHREGVKRFWEISEEAFRAGIPCLTFWAASEDNLLKRSRLEVKFLVSLLRNELLKKGLLDKLSKNEVRMKVVGRWDDIINDKKLKLAIEDLERKTARFRKYRLTVLFGYDGRREIIEAIKLLKKTRIDFEAVKNCLWTGDLPAVDLVIRTGGEPHWSAGFMMWLTADAQLYFTEKLWPEFDSSEFHKALRDYSKRGRRLGE